MEGKSPGFACSLPAAEFASLRQSPVRATMSSTLVTLPNLSTKTSTQRSNDLDLALQTIRLYAQEYLGAFRDQQKVHYVSGGIKNKKCIFSGYCLGTVEENLLIILFTVFFSLKSTRQGECRGPLPLHFSCCWLSVESAQRLDKVPRCHIRSYPS